jgi:hypothetical protein
MVIGTSRCAHVLRYLFCIRAGEPVLACQGVEPLDHRGGVRCSGDAQRSAERSPSNCLAEALLVRMQPRTPPGQVTCCVNGYGARAIPVAERYDPQQFDGQLSPPASHTRSHRTDKRFIGVTARVGNRSLTLDHGSV